MNKNGSKSSNKPIIFTIAAVLILVIFAVVGLFGLKAYEKRQENKIYSVGDTVKFPSFDFKVTKAEFKPVDLPIDDKTTERYGALDKPEDCEKMSKEPTMTFLGNFKPEPYGPSDYNICNRRNDSRDGINKYSASNKQLVVDYQVAAKDTVNTRNLKIVLISDSGRKLDARVDTFNGTQFFTESAQEKTEFGGVIVYSQELKQDYIPYHQSDLGGDINKGLVRKGYTYTDIRNSENSTDIKVTYKLGDKEHTRIIRVTR
jgi:hypothetical protein